MCLCKFTQIRHYCLHSHLQVLHSTVLLYFYRLQARRIWKELLADAHCGREADNWLQYIAFESHAHLPDELNSSSNHGTKSARISYLRSIYYEVLEQVLRSKER